MGYKKCPKCDLNYIRDEQTLCDVCSRKYKDSDEEELLEVVMCSECGERPALRGKELCSACYKETVRQEQFSKQHKPPIVTSIGVEDNDLDGVEVPLNLGEIPEDELTIEERAVFAAGVMDELDTDDDEYDDEDDEDDEYDDEADEDDDYDDEDEEYDDEDGGYDGYGEYDDDGDEDYDDYEE